MRLFTLASSILIGILIPQALSSNRKPPQDFAQHCYNDPMSDIPASPDNRTIPWGQPSIINGTSTCCSSLDEVRAGIDAVDAQLLELLSQRAAFVREATRFKVMHDLVDVPARDAQVIEQAVTDATAVHLPQSVARAVFAAIINSSVPFELCVFDSFHERGH
ncbi:chorismate mutase [Crassisporium funariophilum]|nr:chorismate mutase [Crassisporium funariophilum]